MHTLIRLDRTLVMVGALTLLLAAAPAAAQVFVQCPGDDNGDALIRPPEQPDPLHPNAVCTHLGSGDGFAVMADNDRTLSYIFGFSDLTGLVTAPTTPLEAQYDSEAQDRVIIAGMLAAEWPAPTIELDEGQEWFLTLTNVGMMIRPDLFDPHTVHFHGQPNAAPVFDGLPESGISINMGASLSYYYKISEPGTYMYHCHVEATEHMQMGMLGNLYVNPAQNGTSYEYPAGSGRTYSQFVYNDDDGSTGYDVAYPIQLGSFDWDFHNANLNVQPLPFADMRDEYFMMNGRGYPDTVDVDSLYCSESGRPCDREGRECDRNPTDICVAAIQPPDIDGRPGKASQRVSSLITADAGDRILLRVSNLNVTTFNTLMSPSIPMTVVGRDAKVLRAPTGGDLYYQTSSVTLGGGMSYDVMLDTEGVAPGTYFLYTSNLYQLANYDESEDGLGGMLTEIRIQ